MSSNPDSAGSIDPVWNRVLFFGAIIAGAAVSLPILWLGPGMPLALLAAGPFIVLARFAWPRAWPAEHRGQLSPGRPGGPLA
jgi:hypothetical protein